jgi:spermidine synthase
MAHFSGVTGGSRVAGQGVRGTLYVLFFLTGAAGLAYEVVWTRWLELLLGSSTYAATAVLAAFMGGLALGSVLFGRLADQVRRRVTLYAWLEMAVGLYGLAFPALLALAGRLYLGLARGASASPVLLFQLRFAIALLLVLIPTTLMGGTLPVLVRHLASRREQVGGRVAWLYFINSAGAAAGCLVAGFVAISSLGLVATSTLAVLINVGAGVGALLLRGRLEPAAAEPEREEPTAPPPAAIVMDEPPPALRNVALAALLSGAAALAFEVCWFRLLAMILGSSSDAFTLMLATFIGGLAAGSLWASRRIDRWPRPARTLFQVQIAIGMLVLATLPMAGLLPQLIIRLRALAMGSYPLFQVLQLAVCVLAMAGPTFLLGISFPLLSRLATASLRAGSAGIGRRVGGMAAWTTAGNISGALLGGLVGIPTLGSRWTVTLAAVASLAAGAAVDPATGTAGRRVRRMGVIAAAAVLLIALFPGWDIAVLTSAPFRIHSFSVQDLQRFNAVNQLRRILFLKEDAGATVSVEDRDDNRVLRVNGKPDASLLLEDMLTQRLLAHYPLLVHPDPRNVMIVGLGSGITAGTVLRHPVESVTVAEISPAVVEASRYFQEANHAFWDDPRLDLRVEDARHVMQVEEGGFDVVISEPSNVWMTGVASLYTLEFYEMVRSRLRPGGLFAQWVQGYEMDVDDLRLIARTFLSVFPHATIFRSHGGDLEILGSTQPLEWNFARMERRLALEGVREDLEEMGIRDLYTVLSNQEIPEEQMSLFAGDGSVHVDDLPILEKRALHSLFVDARVILPQAALRIRNPYSILNRYMAGRRPTPQERYHLAAYTIQLGTINNLVLTELEEAVQEDPRHRPALRLLARVLVARKRYGDAVDRMEQAAAVGTPEAEDYRLLARYSRREAESHLGFFVPVDLSESIDAMARCVELAPEREDYRREYAELLAAAGREEEARRQLALLEAGALPEQRRAPAIGG